MYSNFLSELLVFYLFFGKLHFTESHYNWKRSFFSLIVLPSPDSPHFQVLILIFALIRFLQSYNYTDKYVCACCTHMSVCVCVCVCILICCCVPVCVCVRVRISTRVHLISLQIQGLYQSQFSPLAVHKPFALSLQPPLYPTITLLFWTHPSGKGNIFICFPRWGPAVDFTYLTRSVRSGFKRLLRDGGGLLLPPHFIFPTELLGN